MVISALLLVAAVSTGAEMPPGEVAPAAPPLVLPDLQCLGKDGKPLPEATFREVGKGIEISPPVGGRRPVGPPPPAMKCRAPAVVDVEFIITTKGTVCGATVVSELPPECAHYGKAALNAVKRWKYEPARADGKPIPTRSHLQLNWR